MSNGNEKFVLMDDEKLKRNYNFIKSQLALSKRNYPTVVLLLDLHDEMKKRELL